ncbi:MAG: CBS domain-containing protein [Candidatus Rokuibacteriota bacterium]|jgi:CBS domain-containing protein
MRPEAKAPGGSVGDWMSKAPMAVGEDTPIRDAVSLMKGAEVRHLLVQDGPVLTGILSSRDLGRLVTRDLDSPLLAGSVGSIMSEGPVSVAPETPLVTAARLLLEQRIGALPVREGEQIVGIFTVPDALEALLAIAEAPGA